jgi:hypothetical protein
MTEPIPPEALPVATGIGSRTVIGDEGIDGMFIPSMPAMPAMPDIPPAGFAPGTKFPGLTGWRDPAGAPGTMLPGISDGGDPAFGTDPAMPAMPAIPVIPLIPLIPPILPGRPVALGMVGLGMLAAIEAAPLAAAEAADAAPDMALDARLGIAFAGLLAIAEAADAAPDIALDARLGIAFAGLFAATDADDTTEETTDPRLETVDKAEVMAGRLPLPFSPGATQPCTPGRLTQRLDGSWRRYIGRPFLSVIRGAAVTTGLATGLADTAAAEMQSARTCCMYMVE